MIIPIILYGDSILREISKEIDKENRINVSSIINDMFETMHKANGIGLAAIQIGLPIRLFVIEAHIEEENFHFRGAFINPKILRKDGAFIKHSEGCLSIPQLVAPVERFENIELEWYDEDWNYQKKKFIGYESRMIQHEYDHLEGKLYIDYISYMWSETFKVPLNLIEERKMEIPYLWK